MKDLIATSLESSSYEKSLSADQTNDASLEKLYDYSVLKATEAIKWYYVKRNPKKTIGLILRYGSIGSIALAGILPILIAIFDKAEINPAWSAVIVGLAGLMLGIDRFGGFTSGWVRYIVAAQKLNQILEDFRFTWALNNLRPDNSIPLSIDEKKILIKSCQDFLQSVQSIVNDETQKWVIEFQSALTDIETSFKSASEATKADIKKKETGAISLAVSNGKSSEKPWSLSINEKLINSFSGNSAVLADLEPDIFKLKITGIINGKPVEDEKPVIVKGGEISSITMTLL
jgi:hypothetical protein